MTILEVYEKYKHLEIFFSEVWSNSERPELRILSALWQAVKEEATDNAAIAERLVALCEYVEADIALGIQLNAEWAETVAAVREWIGVSSKQPHG